MAIPDLRNDDPPDQTVPLRAHTSGSDRVTVPSPGRRRLGLALTAAGLLVQSAWLCWRGATVPFHATGLALLLVELVGVASTLAITIGLVRARNPRDIYVGDPRESKRFAFAVADIVGRTRSEDLHFEVREVARVVARRRPRRSAEAAMVAVLAEGPRRLAFVAFVTLALLFGQAPFGIPPVWAVIALAAGVALVSASHVVLGEGRIRVGDRVRWSYSSIGEVVVADDVEGVAPRRWVGTIATVVVVSLAVGLRGMSDRWTHGLSPMSDDGRALTMAIAVMAVLGALFTMRTIQTPELAGDHLKARRLEERTARQSALGATVVVGLVGLLAGILPGGVDPADGDPVRVEHLVDDEGGTHAE